MFKPANYCLIVDELLEYIYRRTPLLLCDGFVSLSLKYYRAGERRGSVRLVPSGRNVEGSPGNGALRRFAAVRYENMAVPGKDNMAASSVTLPLVRSKRSQPELAWKSEMKEAAC
ncbi:hypothetical protein AAFF_G00085820 [Aldrovandia affinis]|uniref:Uncharacterized protein n=1 Tax=Aldrovandia affinis TaxID=143900 RepID=A0AAD7RX02_9TELE|nr:hypothetical protein AAFF_G00085820 [Aldrovandia affinis]